ncbi:MAG: Holliday junction branch migration protein RuvA [Myxococcota bacterium]
MIAQLRGHLEGRDGNRAVLDVQGVGYEVFAPGRTLDGWTGQEQITAIVHTVVREDAITLYAFEDLADRTAFTVLLGVNKVGAKMAMSTLDALDLPSLVKAIETDDVATLTRIPGVGKRTAQRLALELKGKLPAAGFVPTAAAGVIAARPVVDGFALALERLGWSKAEVDAGRARVLEEGLDEDSPVGERVRVALKSSLGSR